MTSPAHIDGMIVGSWDSKRSLLIVEISLLSEKERHFATRSYYRNVFNSSWFYNFYQELPNRALQVFWDKYESHTQRIRLMSVNKSWRTLYFSLLSFGPELQNTLPGELRAGRSVLCPVMWPSITFYWNNLSTLQPDSQLQHSPHLTCRVTVALRSLQSVSPMDWYLCKRCVEAWPDTSPLWTSSYDTLLLRL